MSCKQCRGIEETFDAEMAADDLRSYQQDGPAKETMFLINELTRLGVEGQTLLDIGGGVGAIQFALLQAGLASAVDVDGSSAYLETAQDEAQRRGVSDRISYYHGDYVEMADKMDSVDIVTLDRVICCYDDMPELVKQSAQKARRYYGLVYPRDVWWARLVVGIFNKYADWRKHNFCIYVHPTDDVEALLRGLGMRKTYERKTMIWQVALFAPQSG